MSADVVLAVLFGAFSGAATWCVARVVYLFMTWSNKMRATNPGTTPIPLDQFGMAVWRHKYGKTLFVQRDYDTVDRVVVLDETDGRPVIDDQPYSTFNFADWIPMTEEEFAKVRSNYKEIYE